MASFGERLRREREMRGVSLDEIAESTKIGTRSLRALEEEDFSKLPGGIFNKGFVRSYAKFLGLDEDQTVADFNAAFSEYERNRTGAYFLQQQQEAEQAAPKEASFFAPVVVVICLVIVAAGGWKLLSARMSARAAEAEAQTQSAPAQPQPKPAEPIASQPSAPSPAATSAAQNSTSPASSQPASSAKQKPAESSTASAATSAQKPAEKKDSAAAAAKPAPELASEKSVDGTSPIALEIKATADCWMKITSDDGTPTEVFLTAGKSKRIRANEKLELFLGNAGGVQVSYNGKDLGELGPANQSRRLTFTPAGYQ